MSNAAAGIRGDCHVCGCSAEQETALDWDEWAVFGRVFVEIYAMSKADPILERIESDVCTVSQSGETFGWQVRNFFY